MKGAPVKKLYAVVDEEGFTHALVKAYTAAEARKNVLERTKDVNWSLDGLPPANIKRILFGKDGVSIL